MSTLIISPTRVAWVLGAYTAILATSLLLPIAYALAWDAVSLDIFEKSFWITAIVAVLLMLLGHRREKRSLLEREAILLVVLVWLMVGALGALPFYFSGHYPTYSDAFFEAVSGFTTTGATVLPEVEVLSPALHVWRSLTHWLGGMGIVVLGLAVLPLLAQGSQGLYRAEFSGASSKRMLPRITEVAKTLWFIYLVLTLVLFVMLWAAGMTPFDALCHSLSTLGTGGFSTHTASIAAFESPLIEYILILFMLLAGISFIQHYRLWVQGQFARVFTDYEVTAYLSIMLAATLVIVFYQHDSLANGWETALRNALFQVVSITTTTGFVSADYAQWQPLAQFILLVLMFIGGCTGSTAGGLKISRAVLMLRVIQREFRRISEPQAIFRIRLGGDVVAENSVNALLNLVYLAWVILLAASLAVAATGVDILTAFSAVTACQFNIGPGLAGVGPLENYSHFNAFAKWVLSFCMIAGRLEFYTLLVVLTLNFWRR